MITATQARNQIKTKQAQERMALEAQWAKDKKQRKIDRAKAMKETFPSVMKAIEKEIKEAIANEDDSIYFRFAPWMSGELLYEDVKESLEKHGYNVEVECYTPTEGGDSENGGYGGHRTGPDEYSLRISFDDTENELASKYGCQN